MFSALVGWIRRVVGLMSVCGRGVAGAPKSEVRRLNGFIEERGVRFHAAIDRVFGFEEAVEAFGYLREGRHVGKVVVRM